MIRRGSTSYAFSRGITFSAGNSKSRGVNLTRTQCRSKKPPPSPEISVKSPLLDSPLPVCVFSPLPARTDVWTNTGGLVRSGLPVPYCGDTM